MANETRAAGENVGQPGAIDVGNSSAATASSSSSRGETIAKIGTVVSAIVASSCCWLPLVLLAVGVSGAGIVATLGEYREIFMVVTFGFLAMAFYFTYRPRPAVASGASGCQAPCCPPPSAEGGSGKSRFSMMKANKVMLWAVTILAVVFLFFPKYFTKEADAGEFTPDMTRTVLTVEGMTCEACVQTAVKALRGVEGVLAVEVDYPTERATVGTAPDQAVPQKEILAALKAVSYSGEFTDS